MQLDVCQQPSAVSCGVHALLRPSGVLAWQVPSGPQTSLVHALPSLQSAFVVHAPQPAITRKLHTPRLQVSIVQEFESLHWLSVEHAVAVGSRATRSGRRSAPRSGPVIRNRSVVALRHP